MRFASRTDIEAPADFVFRVIADFGHWERAAMRRGAEVVRTERPRLGGRPGVDPVWLIRFAFRGKERRITLRVGDIAAPDRLGFSWVGQLFEGSGTIELIALGAGRTRLALVSEVKPRTLAARMILQSLKLVRGKVQARLDGRMATAGSEIAARWQAAQVSGRRG
jgi:hypothetical protein